MDFAMKREELKVELFRFVDVLPVLKTKDQVTQHLREYFLSSGVRFPFPLKSGLKLSLSNPLTDRVAALAVRQNVSAMANAFIAGASSREAHKKLKRLWNDGYGFTLDILGEAVVSEAEARDYQRRYLELVANLPRHVRKWRPQPVLEETPLGRIPRANVSVKCTSLYSQIDVYAFRKSVEGVKARLRPILNEAVRNGVFIYLDAEHNDVREIVLTVAEELYSEKPFRDAPHLGLVIQAYLKSAQDDLKRVMALSCSRPHPLTIRLVKGAYWDYELILACQRNWPVPVYTDKADTDASYEACTEMLLNAHPRVLAAFGSHNVRSLAYAMAYADRLGLKKNEYEIQMLYGMAHLFKKAVRDMGYRVREYVPIGEMLPGMAYLVRRLLENTSNEGFLRQRFVEQKDIMTLLKNPAHKNTVSRPVKKGHKKIAKEERPMFKNEPLMDFSKKENREWIDGALKTLRKKLPVVVPAIVAGRRLGGLKSQKNTNPADHSEIVSACGLSTEKEAEMAIAGCERALNTWSVMPVKERAAIISKAADLLAEKKKEIMALMVLEVGKNFKDADADVCEAIDFCRYYAQMAENLIKPEKMGTLPGEDNAYFYEPLGIAVSIAPWNFPVAILCGTTVAPLVCGCPVIMKPAEQSPALGLILFETLIEAGVPEEALHFLPGRGEVIGDYLVKHPRVHVISFTGSRAVGLSIIKEAAVVRPGQKHIKKVVAEMGGKNAIIIDDDADLDEAVAGCLTSAFGYAGQKCSALSRIIVLENIYDKFKERFVYGLKSLEVGPGENVSAQVGPVIDRASRQRLLDIIAAHKKHVLAQIELSASILKKGNFVPPTIFETSDFHSDLGQTEFFGPLVTLFKVKNIDEAILAMNDVDYALTGGLFSRSPAHIERARRELEVGNLYINRGITGAHVFRQPFGGFKLSGVGGKAGGPDYLLHFLKPRTVTENTMRRGFAPEL